MIPSGTLACIPGGKHNDQTKEAVHEPTGCWFGHLETLGHLLSSRHVRNVHARARACRSSTPACSTEYLRALVVLEGTIMHPSSECWTGEAWRIGVSIIPEELAQVTQWLRRESRSTAYALSLSTGLAKDMLLASSG